MKYITQFEISQDELTRMKDEQGFIKYRQGSQSRELGLLIGENIGFSECSQKYGETGKRFELEVQVFSMEEWREFKRKLKEAIEALNTLGRTPLDLILIGKLLKELEAGNMLNSTPNDAVSDTTDDDSSNKKLTPHDLQP